MSGTNSSAKQDINFDFDFNRFFDISLDLFVVADPEGYFLQVNDAWTHTLGWAREELLSQTFLNFIHPDDVEPTLDIVERQQEGQKVLHFINRYRCKNGEYRWLEWTSTFEEDGRIYAAARDKTDQMQSERERARFFNISIDLLVIANTDGTFRKINDRWTEIFGWQQEDFLNRPFMDFVHPDDVAPTLAALEREKQGEDIYNFINRYRCKNGNYRWLEWIARPEPDGTIYAVARDITRRKQAEETLAANEHQKRMIFEAIQDLIWLKDADGRYLDCNPSVERFFATDKASIIGKKDADFIDAGQAAVMQAHDDKAIMTGEAVTNEEWLTSADGQYQALLETTRTPMHDKDDNIHAILGIGHDITRRKKAEDANRLLALTDPLTGLANRIQFDQRLSQSLKLAKREGKSLALMMVDLDKFKPVNDTFGHPVGDALLKEVANIFSAATRDSDIVARLGGDEFAILLVHPETVENVKDHANRLISDISSPRIVMDKEIEIGTSIGIAVFPNHADTAEDLVIKADNALYQAKAEGRGQFTLYDT